MAEPQHGGIGLHYLYTYDNAGNRTTTSSTTKTSYAYDAANELCWSYVGLSSNACGSPQSGATSYTHDAIGQRTTGGLSNDGFQRLSNLSGSNALSYLSPSNNELVGDGATTLTNSLLGLDSSVSGARTDYIRDPSGNLVAERTSSGPATSPRTSESRQGSSGTAGLSIEPRTTVLTARFVRLVRAIPA